MAAPATTPTPSITDVRTPEQITADVTRQVESEISDAEAPLKSQIGTLGSNRDAAIAGINSMFGNILPYVQESANKVQSSYQTAESTQQQIYSAANQRLNDLKQSRAQEAQAMAQQMGGPVALGEFTDAVDPAASAYAVEGGGQMLHTLAYGQADVGAANDFAGKVFPLVQTEQTAEARQHYETQIKEIQDQITQLEASKSSAINKGVADAQIAERTYALNKAQQSLDELKAKHDWQASLRTLKQEDKRIALAQNQFKQQKVTDTASIKLEKRKLTTQQQQFAKQLGLSNKEYKLNLDKLNEATKSAQQRLSLAKQQAAAAYLDAAVNPQPGKTITYSQAVPVSKLAAESGKVGDAYADGKSPTGYSRLVTVHEASVAQPITDPNQLVDYLVAHRVQQKNAISMVKARLSLPADWTYKPVGSRHKKTKTPSTPQPPQSPGPR